jgi:hypothetical protein
METWCCWTWGVNTTDTAQVGFGTLGAWLPLLRPLLYTVGQFADVSFEATRSLMCHAFHALHALHALHADAHAACCPCRHHLHLAVQRQVHAAAGSGLQRCAGRARLSGGSNGTGSQLAGHAGNLCNVKTTYSPD